MWLKAMRQKAVLVKSNTGKKQRWYFLSKNCILFSIYGKQCIFSCLQAPEVFTFRQML